MSVMPGICAGPVAVARRARQRRVGARISGETKEVGFEEEAHLLRRHHKTLLFALAFTSTKHDVAQDDVGELGKLNQLEGSYCRRFISSAPFGSLPIR
jgi:hypothetical protein